MGTHINNSNTISFRWAREQRLETERAHPLFRHYRHLHSIIITDKVKHMSLPADNSPLVVLYMLTVLRGSQLAQINPFDLQQMRNSREVSAVSGGVCVPVSSGPSMTMELSVTSELQCKRPPLPPPEGVVECT